MIFREIGRFYRRFGAPEQRLFVRLTDYSVGFFLYKRKTAISHRVHREINTEISFLRSPFGYYKKNVYLSDFPLRTLCPLWSNAFLG